ncbi:Ig-like domain-containing protein [Vibrio fluvialis]|nr:Ig-like domain-containing protein [Vibrio fluvialis]
MSSVFKWGFVLMLLSLLMQITGCNSEGAFSEPKEELEKGLLVSLQITPATTAIPVGFSRQYIVDALFDDGGVVDITDHSNLSWHSSNPDIATIDSGGLATGVTAGTVTITASGMVDGQHFNTSALLTVNHAIVTRIQITPSVKKVPVGLERQYTAMAFLSDGTSMDVTNDDAISWSSSDPSIATITKEGLATGVTEGTVTITASGMANGQHFSGSALLAVNSAVVTNLQVTPSVSEVPGGLERQYTATAFLSDGTSMDVTNDDAISWSSSDPSIATITKEGLATGVTEGTVTITASGMADGQHFSGSALLAVNSAVVTNLQVTPSVSEVPAGLERQYTATAFLSDGKSMDVTNDDAISWSSSDPRVATITKEGLATGVTAGTVTITASGMADGQHFSASALLMVNHAIVTRIQITPSVKKVPVGLERQYTATAFLSDGKSMDVTNDDAISWSSSDPSIATITKDGLATGVTAGTVTITASGMADGQHFSGSALLAVNSAVVTNLQVTPSVSEVPAGLERQYTATAFLSDGTSMDVTDDDAISWSSSDPRVATITKEGLATGVTAGTVTITASGMADGQHFSGSALLAVNSAAVTNLQVTPSVSEVPGGLERQYTATVFLSNGTSMDVTDDDAISWSSSDPSIATITKGGLATGGAAGTVTITASGMVDGQHFSDSALLAVNGAIVTNLQVTPVVVKVAAGLNQQLTATAFLSDGTLVDVTNDDAIRWSSSDPSIATITKEGLATGVAEGTVTITASGMADGQHFSDSALLAVNSAVVTNLQVTPSVSEVPAGLERQYTATAFLSDGTSMDVTNDDAISWSSSDPSIATITKEGLAKGVAAGTVTITAAGSAYDKMLVAEAELVVTYAVEIANISVNGYVFSTEAGFPSTGFIGAQYTLNVSDDAENYVWSSNADWVIVDDLGKVSLIADGNSAPVTITAMPKHGGEPLTYKFKVTKWFYNNSTSMNWSNAADWCFTQGWNQPPYQELSNGKNKRSMGTLWSEWGEMSMYKGAGFVENYYWGATTYSDGHHVVDFNSGAVLWNNDNNYRGVVCSASL